MELIAKSGPEPHAQPYVERVRARPYGPREASGGGVTIWFHGPFAVLTFTDAAASLTVRADLEACCAGADLWELFTAAAKGQTAEVRFPALLVSEQSLVDCGLAAVHRLAVRPGPQGASLMVRGTDLMVEAVLGTGDAARLADEILRWTAARRP